MNEARFANRIRQALNHTLRDIPPTAARRLEAARHMALSHHKQAVSARPALLNDHNTLTLPGTFHLPWARQILAILALLLGMWLSFYWHSVQYISEIEEVDSALLADDLPPEAFLDQDIFEWLKADDSLPD